MPSRSPAEGSPLSPARQQQLLRDLAAVLADGAAAPFVTHAIVEPYHRFFPEASAPDSDPVKAMHRRIYAYAGVPDETPALGFDALGTPTGPDADRTFNTMMLGPICRRAARAWRRRQGLPHDPVREERLVDLTAVALGFGTLLANHELARTGLDGVPPGQPRDPSVDWRRTGGGTGPAALDLDRLLGPTFAAITAGRLTARELVFALAAQVVVRHPTRWSRRQFGAWWRVRTLDRALRLLFGEYLNLLSAPRDALAAQLGFLPLRAPGTRTTVWDEVWPDFDALLGVERVVARRRGLLGRVPGLRSVRLRCSAPRCRAPLPLWSPMCAGCGRPVKGEHPLGATGALPPPRLDRG